MKQESGFKGFGYKVGGAGLHGFKDVFFGVVRAEDKDFCAKAFGDLARFRDKLKGRGATKDEVDENEFGLRILAEV